MWRSWGATHLGSAGASCTDSARPPGPLQRVVSRTPIALPPHRPQPSPAAGPLPSMGRLGAATNHRGETLPPLPCLNRLRCLSYLGASPAWLAARSWSSAATTVPLGSPSPEKDPPSSPPRAIRLPSTAEPDQPPEPSTARIRCSSWRRRTPANGLELSCQLSTNCVHDVLRRPARSHGQLQRGVRPRPVTSTDRR